MNFLKRIGLPLFLLLLPLAVCATHNRAGEITYKRVSLLTYEFTLTMYTEVGNNNATRDVASLIFSDGTIDSAHFATKERDPIATNVEKRTYNFVHTFPGPANYTISYNDENRNQNVLNMASSISTPFYTETFLAIDPLIGKNTSPRLLLDPVDMGQVGQLFLHNPTAYDEDGDSLSFKLVPCKQDIQNEVNNYLFPTPENGFAEKSFSINARNGEVRWDYPIKIGLYNIAIRIEEWRNKKLIGYVVRDMQIIISDGLNNAPIVDALKDTCIVAGTTFTQNIRATDLISGSNVTRIASFSGSGGAFQVAHPAKFPDNSGTEVLIQPFEWKPTCEEVRKEPYITVFKARDDADRPLVGMATWLLHVIAPAIQNVKAEPQGSTVKLTWDKPTDCSGFAKGYRIYRRQGSNPLSLSPCETGLPKDAGYTLIRVLNGAANTSFIDNNAGAGLKPGEFFCYRIVLFFVDGAESVVSNEACAELKKDVPVITNVDIQNTAAATGKIDVAWSKPSELDTVQFFGPYHYELYRSKHLPADPAAVFEKIYSSPIRTSFAAFNDTTFVDSLLNTASYQYTYKVELYATTSDVPEAAPELVSTSQPASSLFLTLGPGDNKIRLFTDEEVPWLNQSYSIYKKDENGVFQLDTVVDTKNSIDDHLQNGIEQCYYIQSTGKYSADGYKSPLLNRSQIACSTPVDNEDPCSPILAVTKDCLAYSDELTWAFDSICRNEIVSYEIYRAAFVDADPELISTLNDKENGVEVPLTYLLTGQTESVAGCFSIVAIDSVGRKTRSNVVCVDNCPDYVLPNVFTPNGDGLNDVFEPFPGNRFNQDIKLTVYNRWGGVVFETTDRSINWDGTDYQTKKKVPSGTYYYVCTVNEIKVTGIEPRSIKGFVTILGD